MFSQRPCKAIVLGLLSLIGFLSVGTASAAGLLVPKGQQSSLGIRDHNVHVIIEDGYVVTEVEQVFANSGAQDFDAVYSFPVPEHAAVAEFTYWIDGKPVTGEVVRKKRAREIYEQEKAAGRETALAEKDEYRTFDISVAAVRAGQDVRTRLVYLQTAHTDTGIGRYFYPLEEGGVDEQRIAFWDVRDAVTGQFSFTLDLKSSYPVDAVRLPSQPGAQIDQLDPGLWRITLGAMPGAAQGDFDEQIAVLEESGAVPAKSVAQSSAAHLDTDIVVYWRHQAGLPGSVDLVTYKPDTSGRGTFMLTLTPGDDLPLITQGRDWVFVLDVSGSMSGKFATLAAGVEQALVQLKPEDRFRIVTFNNSSREITSDYVNATPENVSYYIDQVRNLQANGGTNLYAGLMTGLKSVDADRSSGIVLVTDGVANVGVTEKKKFLKLLEKSDIRLFTFVMGNSANRPLLEAMTEVSNGFSMSASNSDDIAGQLKLATGKLAFHAMHDVDLDIDGIKAADVQPDVIGSVYRGEQLVVFGHYWGEGEADVKLKARVAGSPIAYHTRFTFPDQSVLNPELERLWAYRQIEHLQSQLDYFGADADVEDAIADLAVEYGLVTDFTSMLVVRDEVFDMLGIKRTNRDRVANERSVREQRAAQQPVSRRVDQQQPMFNKSRPSFGGGGGALGLEVLFLLGLALFGRRLRIGGRHQQSTYSLW